MKRKNFIPVLLLSAAFVLTSCIGGGDTSSTSSKKPSGSKSQDPASSVQSQESTPASTEASPISVDSEESHESGTGVASTDTEVISISSEGTESIPVTTVTTHSTQASTDTQVTTDTQVSTDTQQSSGGQQQQNVLGVKLNGEAVNVASSKEEDDHDNVAVYVLPGVEKDDVLTVERDGAPLQFGEDENVKSITVDHDAELTVYVNNDYEVYVVARRYVLAHVGNDTHYAYVNPEQGKEYEAMYFLKGGAEGDLVYFSDSEGHKYGYAALKDNITADIDEGENDKIELGQNGDYTFYVTFDVFEASIWVGGPEKQQEEHQNILAVLLDGQAVNAANVVEEEDEDNVAVYNLPGVEKGQVLTLTRDGEAMQFGTDENVTSLTVAHDADLTVYVNTSYEVYVVARRYLVATIGTEEVKAYVNPEQGKDYEAMLDLPQGHEDDAIIFADSEGNTYGYSALKGDVTCDIEEGENNKIVLGQDGHYTFYVTFDVFEASIWVGGPEKVTEPEHTLVATYLHGVNDPEILDNVKEEDDTENVAVYEKEVQKGDKIEIRDKGVLIHEFNAAYDAEAKIYVNTSYEVYPVAGHVLHGYAGDDVIVAHQYSENPNEVLFEITPEEAGVDIGFFDYQGNAYDYRSLKGNITADIEKAESGNGIVLNQAGQKYSFYIDVTVEMDKGAAVAAIWVDGPAPVAQEVTYDYYVVGGFNNFTPSKEYKLVEKPDWELKNNQVQYAIEDVHIELQTGDNANNGVKILGVPSDEGDSIWFPAGTDNDYIITETGEYSFYFVPNGGVENWHYGYFGVSKKATPAVDPTYYVVGGMNDWAINDDYTMAKAEEQIDGKDVYTLEITTTEANTGIKIKDSNGLWYPGDGKGNAVIAAAGTYVITFAPAGGMDGWHEGYIKAEAKGGSDVVETTYYVVGGMNNWTPSTDYAMAKAEEQIDGKDVYTLEVTTEAANVEIKINDSNGVWYPGAGKDNAVIAAAGTYVITFAPAGGMDGWYEGYIKVEAKEEPPVVTPTAEWHAAAMAGGTNGAAAVVIIDGENHDAIKVGTSKLGGNMTITVGAGATKLSFYVAAWNGVSGLSLNVTGATVDQASIALTSNTGIANNSPFTLAGDAEAYKVELVLTGIEAETTLTFTSSIGKRFVVWDAMYLA